MAFPLVSGTVGDPTDVHAGMVSKRVRVSTVSAGTLASSFESGDTVDGVTLATGDRILIKDQASGAENGIYTVNASGTPTRALDFDESAEVLPGTLVVVSEGTSNKDSIWQLTTNATITVGTTALIFFPVHLQGTGSPESAVTAPVGATYRRTDGSTSTTFYVKESGTGNTGWVAVGSGTPVFAGALAKSASGQTVSNGATDAVAFGAEDADTASYHDNVTNNSRLTVPSTGKYRVNWQLGWTNGATVTGTVDIFLKKNGTTILNQGNVTVRTSELLASVPQNRNASTVLSLTASDYLELYINNAEGSDLSLIGSPTACFFHIEYLGL